MNIVSGVAAFSVAILFCCMALISNEIWADREELRHLFTRRPKI